MIRALTEGRSAFAHPPELLFRRGTQLLFHRQPAAQAEGACPTPEASSSNRQSVMSAAQAPPGVSRTFYKRELPCPPAIEFSSPDGARAGRCSGLERVVCGLERVWGG